MRINHWVRRGGFAEVNLQNIDKLNRTLLKLRIVIKRKYIYSFPYYIKIDILK